jgi:hypothetical protein
MRGHFRYVRFKTFPMTPRTLQCEVFWVLLLNPKHSGVPEDSKSPTLGVLGFTPTLGQSGVATDVVFVGLAHGLLLKTGPASPNRQTRKSTSASLLASPQAAKKKKRYVKLNLSTLVPSNPSDLFQVSQPEEDTKQGDQDFARYDHMGSIGQPAAQKQPGHV